MLQLLTLANLGEKKKFTWSSILLLGFSKNSTGRNNFSRSKAFLFFGWPNLCRKFTFFFALSILVIVIRCNFYCFRSFLNGCDSRDWMSVICCILISRGWIPHFNRFSLGQLMSRNVLLIFAIRSRSWLAFELIKFCYDHIIWRILSWPCATKSRSWEESLKSGFSMEFFSLPIFSSFVFGIYYQNNWMLPCLFLIFTTVDGFIIRSPSPRDPCCGIIRKFWSWVEFMLKYLYPVVAHKQK